MASRWGLTVDEALPQVMEASRITSEPERRGAIRAVLTKVRSLAYHEGSEEERHGNDWG